MFLKCTKTRLLLEICPVTDKQIYDVMANKTTPYVSVVMTSYNREKYIGQAIDSILAQECKFPFEIIIGDDCSTDNSREQIGRAHV